MDMVVIYAHKHTREVGNREMKERLPLLVRHNYRFGRM